ncbi:MAG: efflux RND transporter periplasmic adaptor subunit [Gammaproteobacteria bacterium]|nr:efflux RND transporter periplasmic adaptor subunit [Gammaproteobacteria bacterium]
MLSTINTINTFDLKKLLTFVSACIISLQSFADDSAAVHSSIPGVDCVINPYKVADIASPVAGVIEDLYVERSQQVSAGQIVAQLDADVERASVKLARYRAGIKSEIKLSEINMDFDKRHKIRLASLREKQATSVEKIEEAEREESLSRWKLAQAKELSDIRTLELKRAEQQLSQKSIRAPFDGFVLDTYKHRGEYVEDQSILRLAQLDPLVIEAIVPMENFGSIKVGMVGEIFPEFNTTDKLTGTVSIVDRIGDTASNTFGVRLIMPNPENRIPAGLKCIVKFLQPSAEDNDKEFSEVSNGQQITEKAMVEKIQARQKQVSQQQQQQTPSTTVQAEIVDSKPDRNEKINNEKSLPETDIPMNKSPSGFLVMTRQGETDKLTKDLINRLREAGVNDFQEIDHGIYKGLISLGLYNVRNFAEKRQQALANLGFEAFISARY